MRVDRGIFYLTVSLITISIVFVYSLSIYKTVHLENVSEFHFFIRQFVAGIIGITLMWYISTLDPDRYFIPLGASLFVVFLILMSAMQFFPSEYVKAVNGAKRWITTPIGLSLAPVEFFKIGFAFFLAWSFSRKLDLKKISFEQEVKRLLPYLGLFLVIVYLVAIMQNDFGQVFLMGLVLLMMGLLAGISSRTFLTFSLLGVMAGSYYVLHDETRTHRIMEWLHTFQSLFFQILPESWHDKIALQSAKTQVASSYDAIIHGGLWGTGIGNGVIKLGFLPEIHTDFILSGIAEEIGLFGVIAVIGIYFVLIYKIFKISNRLTNKVYSNFAFGVALFISLAFFINSFGITGVIPIKGIAVPFLSYGGSSMIANCIAIGMVLMISKRAKF